MCFATRRGDEVSGALSAPYSLINPIRDRFNVVRRRIQNMATKLKPLNDRVIVKRLEADARTAGGIILPDSAQEKPKEGIIVAVGDGRTMKNGERCPIQVKAKDRVIFSSYAGTEVSIEGEDLLIMGEDDILAVVK
jgi:chaperonin GroES